LLLPIRDLNPRARFPAVTLGLLLANTVVYLLGLLLPPDLQAELFARGGAIPLEITTLQDLAPHDILPPPFTILSSMFLHAGFLHLLGNMWFLWIFGDNVEERLGSWRYLVFYVLTGVIGAIAQCLLMPSSPVPMVGASGAVAGVLGGYVLLFPRAKIVSLSILGPLAIPAWVFLGVWFAGQLLLDESSGIAWMVHVGGFLAGLGLVRLFLGVRQPTVDVEYLPPPRRQTRSD
jgi:membrane associated rhomboid family serine protease